jgi:hypothetical protein
VSNVAELSELDLLHAYKRQPTIEKRFSQLKTDFAVAPVYLKQVQRHTLAQRKHPAEVMVTDLSRLNRRLLKLLGLPATDYGR